MRISKKHIILGIVCFVSALLQCVAGITTLIPYLAFCLCSFVVGVNGEKSRGMVAVLLTGLVVLPVFHFLYSLLTASLMTTLLANTLIVLVQACVYFALFILVHSWLRKEKFSLSLITGIFVTLCIGTYALLYGLQVLALANAFHQATEHSSLLNWAGILNSGSVFIGMLSNMAFYGALFCISTRFMNAKS